MTILSGCATVVVRSGDEEEKGTLLYPATRLDGVGFIFFCCTDGINMEGEQPVSTRIAAKTLYPLMCLIDLPFSLVSDTAMLPFDLSARQQRRREAAAIGQPASAK